MCCLGETAVSQCFREFTACRGHFKPACLQRPSNNMRCVRRLGGPTGRSVAAVSGGSDVVKLLGLTIS